MLPPLAEIIGVEVPDENMLRLSPGELARLGGLVDILHEARQSHLDLFQYEFCAKFYGLIYEILDLLKIEGYEFSKDGEE